MYLEYFYIILYYTYNPTKTLLASVIYFLFLPGFQLCSSCNQSHHLAVYNGKGKLIFVIAFCARYCAKTLIDNTICSCLTALRSKYCYKDTKEE